MKKKNVETVLAGPSVTSARVATSQKKRKKKEARGNSLFSERSGKKAIKSGKDAVYYIICIYRKNSNNRKPENSRMRQRFRIAVTVYMNRLNVSPV